MPIYIPRLKSLFLVIILIHTKPMTTNCISTPDGFRLSVESVLFTPEGYDPDGPHTDEQWRLEFIPCASHGLRREDVLFVNCKQNYQVEDALENRILKADETTKWRMIIQVSEAMFRKTGWHNFDIVDSEPVFRPDPVIDLRCDYRVVAYSSLEPCEQRTRPGEPHRLVNFEGNAFLLKGANFPGEEFRLLQELGHYQLLSGSRWIPEIGGIVSRQGRREAFIVRYYSGGDLRNHFNAEHWVKRRWVIQLATALAEFNLKNFFHQDIKCANIVVDECNDIRIIDLENCGGTEGWTHPDNFFMFPNFDGSGDFMGCCAEGDCAKGEHHPTLPPPPEWSHFPSPQSGLAPPIIESATNSEAVATPKMTHMHPPEPAMSPQFLGSASTSASPPIPEWAPPQGPPMSDASYNFGPPSHSITEKQRFHVYGFGKTVWELYVGKKPVNEDDLGQTPQWVQELVHGCCKEDTFASIDEVLSYLASHE